MTGERLQHALDASTLLVSLLLQITHKWRTGKTPYAPTSTGIRCGSLRDMDLDQTETLSSTTEEAIVGLLVGQQANPLQFALKLKLKLHPQSYMWVKGHTLIVARAQETRICSMCTYHKVREADG